MNWLQQGDVSPFYAAVADTIRAYLAEAHGVGAMTRTTRELAESATVGRRPSGSAALD